MAMLVALAGVVALSMLIGFVIGYAVASAPVPTTQTKSYVTFSGAGVKVDLNRYLSTPEGVAAVRRACRGRHDP